MEKIRQWLTSLGALTASPWAFFIVAIYTLIWLVRERESFDFHAAATLATWFMTLLIQRAEHRDTQAIHAKLDELLHAQANARSELADVDRMEPEAIEQLRASPRK